MNIAKLPASASYFNTATINEIAAITSAQSAIQFAQFRILMRLTRECHLLRACYRLLAFNPTLRKALPWSQIHS